MTRPFIDRLEGEFAVLIVDGRERRVRVRDLPAGAREGDYLTDDLGAVDAEATAAAKREAGVVRGRLGRDDDGGDFSL